MPLLSGISPNRLSTEAVPGVDRSIVLMRLGTVVTGVAVPRLTPSTVPAVVMPLLVPVGCWGSVRV